MIQKDLKPLEERAAVVENEIREAMAIGTCIYNVKHCELFNFSFFCCLGDGFKEEKLTIEYFKLLNEKNVLVKKQIELNLL